MANPPSRRTSSSSSTSSPYPSNYILPISDNNQFQSQTTKFARLVNSAKFFLRKPHAFPFLLSIFLFLTWVSLRLQHHQHPKTNFNSLAIQSSGAGKDQDANLVRFHSSSSAIMKDKRGWLIDPVALAREAGIPGGAMSCVSIHIGEIRPGSLRGNHRHYFCNETFLIWGAKTLFRALVRVNLNALFDQIASETAFSYTADNVRVLYLEEGKLENNLVDKGYTEVIVGADEVAVATSPRGTAHALVNLDSLRTTFFMGCQDSIMNYNDSTSDFNVWKDVKN